MKILIAVPTRGRVDTIGANTLRWLKYVTGVDWRIFVEPREMSLYERFHPILKGKLVSIGENDRGLMFSLGKIKEYALEHDYDVIVKLDDDLKGWYGKDRKRSLTPKTTFSNGLAACIKKLEKNADIGAIAFSYSNQMFELEEWTERARMQSCYVVRTEDLYVNQDVKVFTDFANYIAIRAKGKRVLRYNWLGMDIQPVGKYPGELQDLDRSAFYASTMKTLTAEFPFLRFREVAGKQWTMEPDMRSVP